MGNKWLDKELFYNRKGFPPSDKTQPDTCGFPQDDEFSIHCIDGGTADLSYYYDWQYVQNENAKLEKSWIFPKWALCTYGLSKVIIMSESILANLWVVEGDLIKRYGFSVDRYQNFKFEDPEAPIVPWLCSLNSLEGKIHLYWKGDPGEGRHFLSVSYEYKIEKET